MITQFPIMLQKEIINQERQKQLMKSLDIYVDRFLNTSKYAYNHKINAFYKIRSQNITSVGSENILFKFRRFITSNARPLIHLRKEGCSKLKKNQNIELF